MDRPVYRDILRRVGYVLLLVGLLDIGWMVYCIVNGISYASSFNLFAAIAGILLIRGGLKTAAFVRKAAIFCLSAVLALVVISPFLQPFGLTLTEIRLDLTGTLEGVVFVVAVTGFVALPQFDRG